MKVSRILPVAAAAALVVGGGGIAASLAADSGRSDARSSVTPPVQKPLVAPTIRAGSTVSRITLHWIRMTVRGHGPNAGKSIRFRIDSSTSFHKVGAGRMSLIDVRLGDRLTVSYRMVGNLYYATRVVDHGRPGIRA
jgi:hypothetical protein